MSTPLTFVLDTGVILQATLNPSGPANRLLRMLESGEGILYLSPQTLTEVEDILSRPAIREKYPHLTDRVADSMLNRLKTLAETVNVIQRYVEYPRDPNDESILNLAIQQKVDFLVSRDKDILDLGQSADFRLLHTTIKVVNPVAVLELLCKQGV